MFAPIRSVFPFPQAFWRRGFSRRWPSSVRNAASSRKDISGNQDDIVQFEVCVRTIFVVSFLRKCSFSKIFARFSMTVEQIFRNDSCDTVEFSRCFFERQVANTWFCDKNNATRSCINPSNVKCVYILLCVYSESQKFRWEIVQQDKTVESAPILSGNALFYSLAKYH